MCQALDGLLRIAEPPFNIAAGKPSEGEIRINQHCSVEERRAIFKLAGDKGERISRYAKRGSIVVSQLQCPSGQPSSFGDLLLLLVDPAQGFAHAKTTRRPGISRREIRITFNGFVIKMERLLSPLPGPFVNIRQSAQI